MAKMTLKQKLIIMVAIPVLACSLYGGFIFSNRLNDLEITTVMSRNGDMMMAASRLITQLQKERGMSNLFLGGAIGKETLEEQRRKTDTLIGPFSESLRNAEIPASTKEEVLPKLQRMTDLRSQVNAKGGMIESFRSYTDLISTLTACETAAVRGRTAKAIGKIMGSIILLENAKESAARLRGMMGGILAKDQAISFTELQELGKFYHEIQTNVDSPALVVSAKTLQGIHELQQSPPWKKVTKTYQVIVSQWAQGKFGIAPERFFDVATKQVEGLDRLIEAEMNVILLRILSLQAEAKTALWLNLGILVLVLCVLVMLTAVVGRSISRPVGDAARALSESGEQIDSASSQIAATSQQLAEGASEQAAGIEQTSSAVEEMASMTRQNADNAAQADALTKEAAKSAEQAKASMVELLGFMEEITRSSEETQKIIKTIDEIAFQTNLLALNAAVEAARAGEAGSGFAVVADEVRSLAMRAAEAAKNTAQLIEGTVVWVKQGADMTNSTNQAFAMVHQNVVKVAELVSEIAAASHEQSEGISQVNTAISEMDKVVQQNAANSEESASAAAELSTQAHQMRSYVEKLVALVGRQDDGAGFKGLRRNPEKAAPQPITPVRGFKSSAEAKPKGGNGRTRVLPVKKTQKTRPEELIPFDEDLSEF